MQPTDKYLHLSSIILSIWPNGWMFVYKLSGCGFESHIQCGFILIRVPDMIGRYSQIQSTDKYAQLSSIISSIWPNSWAFVYQLCPCGFESSCIHLNLTYRACFKKRVPWDSGKYIECGFSLKCGDDTIRRCSQMHRTDKYSKVSSIILSIWPNGWVFVYELSGCGLESPCSHLNLRYRTYFEQRVRWDSAKYRLWIHSETCTRHDKIKQSNTKYR